MFSRFPMSKYFLYPQIVPKGLERTLVSSGEAMNSIDEVHPPDLIVSEFLLLMPSYQLVPFEFGKGRHEHSVHDAGAHLILPFDPESIPSAVSPRSVAWTQDLFYDQTSLCSELLLSTRSLQPCRVCREHSDLLLCKRSPHLESWGSFSGFRQSSVSSDRVHKAPVTCFLGHGFSPQQ